MSLPSILRAVVTVLCSSTLATAGSPLPRGEGALSDASEVDILETYRQAIFDSESLVQGNVEVLRIADGSCAVVVVGTKSNQAQSDPTPKAHLKNRTLARLAAERALVISLGTEVSTHEEIRKTVTTTTATGADGTSQTSRRIQRALESVTVEEAQAKLRGAKTVGTWYSSNKAIFNMGLAVQCKCP